MNEKECFGKDVSLTNEKKHFEKFKVKCFTEDLRVNQANYLMPPFVEFFLDKETEYTKLAYIIQAIKNLKNFKVVAIPDGGFVYNNFEWYTPLLSFHLVEPIEDDRITFFENLFLNLEDSETEKPINVAITFLNICDLFENKETGVILRMQRLKDKCTLYVEIEKVNPNYSHIVSLLKKSGLKIAENISTDDVDVYRVSSNTFCVFESRLQELYEVLKEELNIVLPEEEYEGMNFYGLVRMKRRQFGNSPKGIEQLNNFIILQKDTQNKEWQLLQNRFEQLATNFQNNV